MDVNLKRFDVGTTRWPRAYEDDRWVQRTRSAPSALVDAWAKFLGRIPWQWFITLTFDPKKRFPVSRDLASREAFKWCGLVGYTYRKPVGWVYAVERHESGLHHVHVLLVGLSANGTVSRAVDVWRQRNGEIVDARRVGDTERLALYASKSVAADGEIALSDTLERYQSRLAPDVTVRLFKHLEIERTENSNAPASLN